MDFFNLKFKYNDKDYSVYEFIKKENLKVSIFGYDSLTPEIITKHILTKKNTIKFENKSLMLEIYFNVNELRIGYIKLSQKNSNKNIKYIDYYLDGNILSTSEDNIEKQFFPNGQLKRFRNTRLKGNINNIPYSVEYYENGNPRVEYYEYRSDTCKRKITKTINYYINGNMRSEIHQTDSYDLHNENGPSKLTYDPDGNLIIKEYHLGGRKLDLYEGAQRIEQAIKQSLTELQFIRIRLSILDSNKLTEDEKNYLYELIDSKQILLKMDGIY